ncbi:molybdenum cofactor guanylyltransferase [bacterium]|nr:molybdenum cofactor guanylyltransferase [bacterium]
MIQEAFVLAGGASRRMGQPKALMTLGGKTFLERILESLGETIPRVFIVGSPPDPQRWKKWEIVPDILEGEGVLAGIHAGLSACKTHWAFVAACDVPAIDKRLPKLLWDEATGREGCVMPYAQGFPQPTMALYRAKEGVRIPTYLERTAETNLGRKLHGFLDRVGIQMVDEKFFVNRGIPRWSFSNCNDLRDYEQLCKEWKEAHADTTD